MEWTVPTVGNTLGAAWLALAALGATTRRPRRTGKAVHNGTGLVLWGSYLVALLALNLHTAPFGTLPLALRYAGLAVAGASLLARLVVLALASGTPIGGLRRVGPICSAIYCMGLTAASGDLIALVTVIVAASAAAGVAVSDVSASDWDSGTR